MREIKLLAWEDFPKHVGNVKISLEEIYEVELRLGSEEVSFDRLYPTEEFLEKDKLTLVFMKTLDENYDVPIITAKRRGDYFILDGHHRSFILKKLMKPSVKAQVLEFPSNKEYRERPKRLLENIPIRDVAPIDDPIVKAWAQILTLLKYYEVLYEISFSLQKQEVRLKNLVPTQPQVLKRQIEAIERIIVPIVCIEHHDKFYILDGHARSLRARKLRREFIRAITLVPSSEIDFGIVKMANYLDLSSLEDIKIIDNLK